MKTFLVAAMLVLAVPTLAQSSRYVTLTLQLDEAAADPATGLMPARVIVAHPVGSGPIMGGVTLRSFAAGEIVVPETTAWRCTTSPFDTHCTFGEINIGSQKVLDFFVRFPDRAGRAHVIASVSWSMGLDGQGNDAKEALAVLWRRFAGPLRQMIETVNADPLCAKVPCRIELAGPAVIEDDPLPMLDAADVEVVTNGAPVELLGTNTVMRSGLSIRAARMTVRGLTITGFPGHGLVFHPKVPGSRFTIEQCSITNNGGRGIVISEGVIRDSAIRDNYIADNLRSGIFVATAEPGLLVVPVLTITRNAIGGNGASGIFLGPQTQQVLVSGNTIAHNLHFGIAVAQGALQVRIAENRITANGQIGIDYHLNGPTGEFDFTNRGAVATLESATYDAATNTTTITGTGPYELGWLTFDYAFYANAVEDREGEQFLGSAPGVGNRVTLKVPGDLRGKYITAAITRGIDAQFYETYEFSAPILVK